jgi:hypothetical protein
MEKFLQNLQEAENKIKKADHWIYTTYPLIKEKKFLLKILEEINAGIGKCINSILQYEYLFKKIPLFLDPKKNFETFQKKCGPRFSITFYEINLIKELFEIIKAHKNSSFEFVKEEKVIILFEKEGQKIVNLEKTKEFLIVAKSILKKTKSFFKNNFSR